MNMYTRAGIVVILLSSCVSTMAADRFTVKYKLTESQESFLAHSSNKEEAEEKIRIKLMDKLSNEQLNSLSEAANKIHKDKAVEVENKIHATYAGSIGIGAHAIILSKDLNEEQTEQFIREVGRDNSVEYIEEEKTVEASSMLVNDAYQWDMTGPGEFLKKSTWSGDNFGEAWNILDKYNHTPGKNVVIAVLDTGYTPHPNYINNLQPLNEEAEAKVYGYTMISDCRKSGECSACTTDINNILVKYTPDALDLGDFITTEEAKCLNKKNNTSSSWHGSHVIGTIIGSGYNNGNPDYIVGGAHGATVIPVRVLGKTGGIGQDTQNAILWAAGFEVHSFDGSPVPVNQYPAHIINLSLGGKAKCSKAYQEVIDKVIHKGVIVVVAAGNDKDDVKNYSPANCNGVISVAAKGPTGKLAYYSNFGNTTITASGGDVTIQNPLSKIYSTGWSSKNAYQNMTDGGNCTWIWMQGTSMAAPHVTAAIANLIGVLKEQGKEYSLQELVDILQKTAVPYDRCNKNGCCTTEHSLNVGKAISYVLLPRTHSSWVPWLLSQTPSFILGGIVMYVVAIHFR